MRLLIACVVCLFFAAPSLAQDCKPGETRGAVSTDGKVRVFSIAVTADNANQRIANLIAEGTWRELGYRTSGSFSVACDVGTVTIPPPTPVNCVLSEWSAWTVTGTPTACVNNQQNVTEQRTRTVLTPPSNGGLACAELSESRTVTQTCTSPTPEPIPPSTLIFDNGWERAAPALGCNDTVLRDNAAWTSWGGSDACTSNYANIVLLPGQGGVTSRMLQTTFRPDGSINGPDFRIQKTFGENYANFYASWWYQTSPNWVWASADHKIAIFGTRAETQDVYFNIRGNGNGTCGRPVIYVVRLDTMWSDPDVRICGGEGHLYEIHIPSGGRVEAKVDGRLLNLRIDAGQATTPIAGTQGVGNFKLDTTYNAYSYPSGLKLTMYSWYDNAKASATGWIGQP